jgi:hypothetical protein
MNALENQVWRRMLDARMNKYYHQASVQYLSWLNSGANVIAVFALGLAGFSSVLGIEPGTLQRTMFVAAVFPLVVVVLGVPGKIAHHESLFRDFNELETRLALANGRFDRGEGTSVQSLELDQIEEEFHRLEAKQAHAFQILLRYCDSRVRAEVGELDHYWPLPIFRSRQNRAA